MSTAGPYKLDHLNHLSDERGIFEHADGTTAREENGYCTDDNARLLIVASREPDEGLAHTLGRLALRFVLDAQSADGMFRNRMDHDGHWVDRATTEDCWGRALWALGAVAANHNDQSIRTTAL